MPTDQAPISSGYVRRHLLRAVPDQAARLVDRAEFSTRVTADSRAHTTTRLPLSTIEQIPADVLRYDDAIASALRKLPGADAGITAGSPGRTYEVYWDGVRAPI
jgi:hypothetical protein